MSVCAPFCHYNSKTVSSIKVKFGGQAFRGVQTDFAKFISTSLVYIHKVQSLNNFCLFNIVFRFQFGRELVYSHCIAIGSSVFQFLVKLQRVLGRLLVH